MEQNYIGKSGQQTSYESIVRQHENTIVSSFTIDATNNAFAVGPVTISATATVTNNGTWIIL